MKKEVVQVGLIVAIIIPIACIYYVKNMNNNSDN